MKYSTKFALKLSASFLTLAGPAYAQSAPVAEATAKAGPQLGTFGIDTDGMDKSVAPADDFLPVR